MCVVLFAAAVPAAGAATPRSTAPEVRLTTLHLPGAGDLPVAGAGARAAASAAAPVRTLDAGAVFRMAGLICDVPGHGSLTVGLRTSSDGVTWSRWFQAPLEVVDDGGRPQAYTDPLWTGPARYVQVRARGADGAPEELTGVRVVTLDPGADDGHAGAVPAAARGASPADTPSPPAIVTRAEWGADEKLRADDPEYAPVKVAFVHHTASGNGYTEAEAPGIVRAIYAYHTKSLHWDDIGYNFIVDRFGTIYEGRYGGIDRGVVGAQVGGFNTGSTGISVIGTFTDVTPPAIAVSAVERLLAWKLAVAGLDPNGTGVLTCGLTDMYKKGAEVTFPVIAGHRDANFTECPGDKLYALLPAIRADVAQRLTPEPVTATLTASSTLLSPNGDGVADDIELTGSLNMPADWRLVVRNAAGQSVASWSGHGAKPSATWKGTNGGDPAPDGAYTAELTATSLAGESGTASVAVTLDTTPPRLRDTATIPASFSPDGDGQNETAKLVYSPAEACEVRVGILAASGTEVLRWLRGWRKEEADTQSLTWDGRVLVKDKLTAAPDGRYRFAVERRDAAGNTARQGVAVLLDRTLGFATATPAVFSPNGDTVHDETVLGFRLTRKATVTLKVTLDGKTVRTLALGVLQAGKHTAAWDGRTRAGAATGSSRPEVAITAKSALGTSSVTEDLVVDLTRPKLSVSRTAAAKLGEAAVLSCTVSDAFSERAGLSFEVTDARGRRVSARNAGQVATGQAVDLAWKPRAKGTFTVTWHATDLAGNTEAKPATTTVTVR